MGFVRKHTGLDLTGGGASDAAGDAARKAERAQRQGLATLRADLSPFKDIGTEASKQLMANLFNYQPQDVMSNPFFQAMAREQENQLLNERSALGLAGSGGTADALTRNLLLLGNDFQQQDFARQMAANQQRFNQIFNTSTMGQNAAAQTGTATLNTMANIGDIQGVPGMVEARVKAQQGQQLLGLLGSQGGNMMGGLGSLFGSPGAVGAGTAAGGSAGMGIGGMMGSGAGMMLPGMGASAGMTAGMMGGIQGAMAPLMALSDRRMKRDIVKIGEDEHGNIYRFRYLTDDAIYEGRMADELAKIRPDAVKVGEDGYMRVIPEFYPVEVA
jgi:hypothetical protein